MAEVTALHSVQVASAAVADVVVLQDVVDEDLAVFRSLEHVVEEVVSWNLRPFSDSK